MERLIIVKFAKEEKEHGIIVKDWWCDKEFIWIWS